MKMESLRKLLIGSVLILGLISGAACQSSDWLRPHNSARAAVGVAGLQWDQTLANYANSWAKNLANTGCGLSHRPNNPYGENIYWASWASKPGDAVSSWVDEKQFYNYASNTCASGKVCGHYTQVVWRNSQFVGCASVLCSSGATISVCNYNPPGNYNGQKPYLTM